jgi:hypothetical protein
VKIEMGIKFQNIENGDISQLIISLVYSESGHEPYIYM